MEKKKEKKERKKKNPPLTMKEEIKHLVSKGKSPWPSFEIVCLFR